MNTINSWLEIKEDSDFTIHNIPFGIFSHGDDAPRAATRIGDSFVDLAALADNGYFSNVGGFKAEDFHHPVLNEFIARGKKVTSAVRDRIIDLFSEGNDEIRSDKELLQKVLYEETGVRMHMPVRVPNYTDFYASEYHAYNVGVMFRDPDKALLPNWKHIPVGYHGRASSIVVSGTPIHRPKGQSKPDNQDKPIFGPSKQVDFELEVGFVIGKSSDLGESIRVDEAEDHIFGLVLFNDLSARDIQKWEYVPLGPFLGKNFGSVISPWIVTLEALEPFRTSGPPQEPKVLPYLQYTYQRHFDVELEVELIGSQGNNNSKLNTQNNKLICSSNFRYLYWSMAQMLAHHTVNGCNLEVGDIYATGTISGPEPGSFGSMLEIAWKGTRPVDMPDGSERKFIEDFDTIVLRGYGEKNGIRVGFGECKTTILPSK
jgi:fumarylacetoacetase